jgi:D-sedoheptulose 7-phosphate isomerase
LLHHPVAPAQAFSTCFLDAPLYNECAAEHLRRILVMGEDQVKDVRDYYQSVSEALLKISQEPVEQIIASLKQARAEQRRIFIFGNGGSAANASHFVVDVIKSTVRPDQPRYKIICLNDNMPTVTAYSNDVSYDVIFSEPLAALAEPGDVAIAISGSGNSPNVLRAMDTAKEMGLARIGLTGYAGGRLKDRCDVCVIVPSDSMQVIEDAHLVILHSVFLALLD